jgi:hypothetical protein
MTNTALPDFAAEWNGRSKKTECGAATQNPTQALITTMRTKEIKAINQLF